ncbi:MAG: hypothetical protein GEV03_14820 [Streptosporangiales bacterium]|nr:hypothetical protein [Streptosporangiales bacterium]
MGELVEDAEAPGERPSELASEPASATPPGAALSANAAMASAVALTVRLLLPKICIRYPEPTDCTVLHSVPNMDKSLVLGNQDIGQSDDIRCPKPDRHGSP